MNKNNIRFDLRERGWQKNEGIWLRGRVFRQDVSLAADQLKALLEQSLVNENLDVALLKTILRNLNGFYSFIWTTPSHSHTLLVADIVRAFPLFYTFADDSLIVSDRLDVLASSNVNVTNIFEFLLTGYVTGPETILDESYQVQAGEAVLLNHRSGKISRILYNSFNPRHPRMIKDIYNFKEKLSELDTSLTSAVDRLINILDGRLAVIPLSGGWDSRMVLLHLKRQGYSRILAFSYGKEGNAESLISRELAKQLGVKWVFVPYSTETWRKLAFTEEYREYLIHSHNAVSVPHIQDFLAVRELLRNRIISQNDAMLIPGHTGDFLSGGHLQYDYGLIRSGSDLINAILSKHYVLLPPKYAHKLLNQLVPNLFPGREFKLVEALSEIYKKIQLQVQSVFHEEYPIDAYAIMDLWNWRERQAKFIVNSVKVYEFWDLDFWLPLWDIQFVKFWESLPLQWRINRTMQRHYMLWLHNQFSLDIPVISAKAYYKQQAKYRLKQLLHMTKLLRSAKLAINYLMSSRVVKEYNTHPLQWYGIWDKNEFVDLVQQAGGQININTLVVIDSLKKIYGFAQ